jgi:hypothetical protein
VTAQREEEEEAHEKPAPATGLAQLSTDRSGKWSEEEEDYAVEIMRCFHAGLLDLEVRSCASLHKSPHVSPVSRVAARPFVCTSQECSSVPRCAFRKNLVEPGA